MVTGNNTIIIHDETDYSSSLLSTSSSSSLSSSSRVMNTHTTMNESESKKKIFSLPLIPHHVEWERRRRERRDLLSGDNTNNDNSIQDDEDDSSSSSSFERRHRRDEAQQVGALYQGYGTHYVDLWVGTPSPQRQTVIVDTGSGVTAFPCSGCGDCGVPNYHIDGLFMEDQSESFRPNQCNTNGDCVANRSTCSVQKKCSITMSYAEGSRWTAYEGVDRCYVAGPHEIPLVATEGNENENNESENDDLNPNHAADLAFDLTFGCQTVVTGLFKTQLADGIMGMSDATSTYWSQMYRAQKISAQAFSLCFSRQPLAERKGTEAGAMTLGGVDQRLHLTPMVFTPDATRAGMRPGFFNVKVRRIFLREGRAGESAKSLLTNPNEGVHVLDVSEKILNTGGVIVDSGTTDTYWNRAIALEFNNIFQQLTQRTHNNNAWELTEDELHALPTVLFQLYSDLETTNPHIDDAFHTTGMAGVLDTEHPSDIILAFPPTHYMEYDDSNNMYTSRFYPTEGRGSVLGANAMMGHDIFFDVDNNRIGWAESLCDYTKLVQEHGYDFEITGELKGPETIGKTTGAGTTHSSADHCESYSSGAKCQSAEGCTWYWGKCSKNNDEAPSEHTAAPTTTTNQDDNGNEPDLPPPAHAGSDTGADRPPPIEEDDDEISKFLDECKSPACRYPVLFGLIIALITGCCLSYCFFRICSNRNSVALGGERYKYTQAKAEAIEIEMTNGNHTGGMNGNSHHSNDSGGVFRDDPEEVPSSTKSVASSNGNISYRDEPAPGEVPFTDEPEFEGDFA
ncbi:xylanase inhibitor [Nitzschia inconspicua]|uniref:Xylanase inhibitor n=1 Tax=Nitzschia inconspicua TaxID=303405 RepID=A0A9K3KR88_9STRA|nr:xylanase inhibitor [Nitzschia inconspicua]